MDPIDPARLPLRERKRLAAMRRIQTVALELFEAEGFDTVTVERIADAAEVSPSSVYRWFGTKEHLIIWDEYDPAAIAAFESAVAQGPPVQLLGAIVRQSFAEAVAADADRIHRRMRLAFANPSVEAASALHAYTVAGFLAAVLKAAEGGPDDDLGAEVLAHAVVGGLMGALRHWVHGDFSTPIEEVVERALGVLDVRWDRSS